MLNVATNTYLEIPEEQLINLGAIWTAREIAQQPKMLKETHTILMKSKHCIEKFLQSLLASKTRVILTGAGTSAYIGECLAPALATQLKTRVEAIATTDLVSAPQLYFEQETPTLIVSFARSGNSPESLAAIKLANQFIKTVSHLIITCNKNGKLIQYANNHANTYTIVLPDATHDQSFAMTSSFSCMALAALSAFTDVDSMRIDDIVKATQQVFDYQRCIKQISQEGYERVVYLGSHLLRGLAREASLKLLELSNGNKISLFESPLGFRHGPKTIINSKTLVVIFFSNHEYTRRYDLDLLKELQNDNRAARIIVVTAQDNIIADTSDIIHIRHLETAHDTDLLFPYIIFPQLLAFYESLELNLTPDNPNICGEVNRVVQGVHIHEFRES